MWLHVPSQFSHSTVALGALSSDSPRLCELAQSVTVRGSFRASKFLLKELRKAGLMKLLFTAMSPPSLPSASEELTSSQQDFHVSRGVGQTPRIYEERMMKEMDGPIPFGSFARFDPVMSCWRTSQISLITGTLEPFSETWPKKGTLRNGTVSREQTSEHPRSGKGCSYWPTPTRRDWKDGPAANYDYPTNGYLGREVPAWTLRHSSRLPLTTWKDGHECGKKCLSLSHRFVCWVQGFPIGWASCKSLETRLFQQWELSHSNLLQKVL